MRAILITILLVLAGCGGISAERLKEINSEWWRIYNVDRCQTASEATEFAGMDDAGKAAWLAAHRPGPGPLNERTLDAAKDYKEAIDEEATAAE
jgi:hypothetical protein